SYDQAFENFIKKIPQEGILVHHEDDESSKKIAAKVTCQKITTEKNFKTDLQIPGKHNQKNAALAAALGKYFGISQETIRKSLSNFAGTMRRFEYKGIFHHENGQTKIYDDYGHHPVEIRATLQAAREKFPTEKILAVFQPHQFSRTKFFLEDFKTCFADADAVLIPNIYEARDATEDKEGMSKEILAQKIRESGKKVYTEESEENIEKIAAAYEVVITIGAGNVWEIGKKLIHKK
ncbi:MAG: cyanophycin synthetase, partial [Patescibacteria group bacterium]